MTVRGRGVQCDCEGEESIHFGVGNISRNGTPDQVPPPPNEFDSFQHCQRLF